MQHFAPVSVFILLCLFFTSGARGQTPVEPESEQFSLHSLNRICRYNNGSLFPSGSTSLGISFTGIGAEWPGVPPEAAPDSVPLASLFNIFDSTLNFPDYRREWFYPEGELTNTQSYSADLWRNNLQATATAEYSKQTNGYHRAKIVHVRTWAIAESPKKYDRNFLLIGTRKVTTDGGSAVVSNFIASAVIPAHETHSSPVDFKPGNLITFANNARTETMFTNTYKEQIAVSLLPVEVSWKAIDGFVNVDDHVDPWNKPIYGKRIFPDFKNPDDTEIRNKLEVIVKTSPALFGKAVFVKAFDVDDSTSETFDKDENGSPVIDNTGIVGAGDDNLPDYLNTPQNGRFWTGTAWGGQTAQGTVDANGETKFIFLVGMQPGNNYRIVASVNDESMYAGVQTSNPTAAKYLGPEASQNGGTAASPLLTVWRRLWVENDSMKAPGLHADGYLKNDLTSDVSSPTVKNSLIANGETIVQFLPVITDQSSLRNLENGTFILPPSGVYNQFIAFANNGPLGDGVTISGAHPEIQPGQPFRLYDDDDFGLNRAPLPRNDLIDDTFKNVYKPAFIEAVDAAYFKGQDYNPSKTVDFYRNHPVMVGFGFPLYILGPGVWDDAINLTDSKPLWVGNLIAGYQGEVGQDGDPNDENNALEGITPGSRKYSIVYVETVRDQRDILFRNSSVNNTTMNSEISRNIKLTAAHEIGHMPGNGDETSHHAEGLLMGKRGYDYGLEFSPNSILRFRKTNQWQQP